MKLAGKRITVMGLGRFGGGTAAVRYLVQQGARVTVSDQQDVPALAAGLAELRDLKSVRFHLGGHREADLLEADLLVVSPAVPPHSRWLQLAREAGIPQTSELELFVRACPAPTVAVTGTNGKSTTAAMVAHILQAAGRRVWLGGNIGGSLLGQLDRIGQGDMVVLEVSSFQLARLQPGRPWPKVALITNCYADHLDWHGGFENYAAAKRRLLGGQDASGIAILNTADCEVDGWRGEVRGTWTALEPQEAVPPLNLPGEHNRENARLAITAAAALGVEQKKFCELKSFSGLPHRLETVAEIDGRLFINDSLATIPQATMAAVRACERPIWLLCGGRDKGLDYRLLSELSAAVRGVGCFGETGPQVAKMLADQSPKVPFYLGKNLANAFRWCWQQSSPGNVILLSPAAASYDQFADYRERGAAFRRLVEQLERAESSRSAARTTGT